VVTSQGYFPKWQLAKCVISQAETSQAFLAAALGPLDHPSHKARPHCSLRRFRGPNLTFGKLPLGKLHTWEVGSWEIVTWEIVTWETSPLGKCLWESI